MVTTRRHITRVAVTTCALAAIVVAASCSSPKPVETNDISISNNKYVPNYAKIKMGTALTWHNDDGVDHTVTFDKSPTPNQLISPNGKAGFTPGVTGTFGYHCEIHKFKGQLVVVE